MAVSRDEFVAFLSGASGVAGERFFLRWEALGANRDQPREQPWPPPSQLRVIRMEN